MQKSMRKSLLSALIATSFAATLSLPVHAEQKDQFNVCWTIYAGWMPWEYAQAEGIVDKWAKKYDISIDVTQINDYVESINQYTAGQFDGCTMMDVEFDDRKYTGSHYGHLCRAQIRPDKVTIMDEREGSQNQAIKAMREDPAKTAEVTKLMEGKNATFPVSLQPDQIYTVVVETVGGEMRVSIDGKPVAYLKSPGIGHATKSKIELGVAGQSGWFDDIKIWNAAPVK